MLSPERTTWLSSLVLCSALKRVAYLQVDGSAETLVVLTSAIASVEKAAALALQRSQNMSLNMSFRRAFDFNFTYFCFIFTFL